MRLTYIGHATLLLEIDGVRVLTDPNFNPRLGSVLPRVSAPGIALRELPKLDAVLLTHAHADHLSFNALNALPRDIPLFTPPAVQRWLTRKGYRHAVPIAPGEEVTVQGLTLRAAAARHLGNRYVVDRWRAATNMYLLESPNWSAFFAGARPAEAGEFTRRAVLNGQIDLLQAEAIGDLIDASSQRARRAAVDQLDGGLSRRVLALRDALIELEALIAYDIDFPEEDDGPISAERVLRKADETIAQLDALLSTARAGELVRAGALVVIAGAPNAGKSSLFNALLGRRRAIVTDVPGTTRDALEAVLDAGRWPLRLVDTAGLRETLDVVERIGVEVSEEYLAKADVVLACGESTAAVEHAIQVIEPLTTTPIVAVRTKSDIADPADAEPIAMTHGAHVVVATSAESGTGLDALIAAIEQVLDESAAAPALDIPLLTHERHRQAITHALGELAAFRDGWAAGVLPAPVAAVHLREGVQVLEELVGSVDVEDVLGRVFSRFCVGK